LYPTHFIVREGAVSQQQREWQTLATMKDAIRIGRTCFTVLPFFVKGVAASSGGQGMPLASYSLYCAKSKYDDNEELSFPEARMVYNTIHLLEETSCHGWKTKRKPFEDCVESGRK